MNNKKNIESSNNIDKTNYLGKFLAIWKCKTLKINESLLFSLSMTILIFTLIEG